MAQNDDGDGVLRITWLPWDINNISESIFRIEPVILTDYRVQSEEKQTNEVFRC